MPKKSKPPLTLRKVFADDLEVRTGGETYYPHVGESVTFKGRPTVGLYLGIARFGRGMEGLELLADQIHAWDWTDDEGKAFASPPTVSELMRIPDEELGWLIQHVGDEPRTEDVAKND